MSNTYLLEMQNISKSYIGVQAIKDVSFRIRPGTVHALVGENGAGKSTLMKILAGETQPNSGKILIEGKEVSFNNRKAAIDNGVSIIHQEMINLLDMTVAENLFLGREFRKSVNCFIDWKKMNKEAKKLLNNVKFDIEPTRKMGTLTVAQMQMCEIAKAVSYKSKIIIMDEPTSAITESETEVLFDIINKLRNEGCGIIYISHKLDEIYKIADEISIMRDGLKVAEFPNTDVPRNLLIKHMVDRDIVDIYPKRNVPAGDVALEVKNLTKKGQFSEVSFKVHFGEILGLAGLMGAGRTEIVEAIFGMTSQCSGEILVKGQLKKIKSPIDAMKAGIGLITDDRKLKGLVMGMNIADNIALPVLKKFMTALFKLLNWRQIKSEAKSYVNLLKIKTPGIHQNVSALSGGNQQKVVLSKLLIKNPDVLIFDEPTRGIDIAAKTDFYNHISSLAEKGKAIIFISSELQEVVGMCDRLIVLRGGIISGELKGNEISQENIVHIGTGK